MIIYKTTNLLDGKIYVGQDSNNSKSYYGSGIHLVNAIKLYGKRNFKKEILQICNSFEELNEREIYWIDKLNARNKDIGYNIAFGGADHVMTGRTHTVESKEKMSESQKTLYKNGYKNPMLGKKLSDEAREKMKKSRNTFLNTIKGKETVKKTAKISADKRRGKKRSAAACAQIKEGLKKLFAKTILQMDMSDNIVGTFFNYSEIKEKKGYIPGNISKCVRGLRKTAHGFKWKLK